MGYPFGYQGSCGCNCGTPNIHFGACCAPGGIPAVVSVTCTTVPFTCFCNAPLSQPDTLTYSTTTPAWLAGVPIFSPPAWYGSTLHTYTYPSGCVITGYYALRFNGVGCKMDYCFIIVSRTGCTNPGDPAGLGPLCQTSEFDLSAAGSTCSPLFATGVGCLTLTG